MLCPEPVLFIYFFNFSSVILQFGFCDYFSAKKTDFFFFFEREQSISHIYSETSLHVKDAG